MKTHPQLRPLIVSTMGTLIASGLFIQSATAVAADKPAATERCFGIAKAGKNACSTARHGCSGMATKDNQPDEWTEVPVGSCKAAGGSTTPPSS